MHNAILQSPRGLLALRPSAIVTDRVKPTTSDRVAISISDGRISPLFDAARRLLLVDVENGHELRRSEHMVQRAERGPQSRRVAELGVDVLICGAISRPLEAMLVSADVEPRPADLL